MRISTLYFIFTLIFMVSIVFAIRQSLSAEDMEQAIRRTLALAIIWPIILNFGRR